MSADGTWNVTLSTPMGAQPMTLTLKTSGDALEGSISGQQGTQAFEGGKVDGDSLSWKVSIEQPMQLTIEFSATLDGDKISGNAALGQFGSATFEGARA